MNRNQTIALSQAVLSQEVAGETVLLDLASESYFGLDPVGTRVWQLIREKGQLQQIIDTLLDEYEVEETQLLRDLEILLDDAQARGLISLEAGN